MDTWYATRHLMLAIEDMGKLYCCPLKKNRLVDDSGGIEKYQRIEDLTWTETELAEGKTIKINKFPRNHNRNHKVKLFRVPISADRTDYIATNDVGLNSTEATREVCGQRWKIEQFHRELKQTTGLEKCQCRKGRIQRNHIACAMWYRCASNTSPTRLVQPSINSNGVCLMSIWYSNSEIQPSKWKLRKS